MPDPATIRIGTRGSELATTQAGHVRDALIELGQPAELVIVKTAGDHNRHDPVEKIGIGVFTQALRHALREGVCDIIVHSFKDLPTLPEDDMMVAAVPERVDPREALISRDATPLMDLPEGARVGTSAPRRVSQLRALRSDLELVPLRGNIETRMGRVSEDLDAVILARAGLERTGRLGEIAESLDVDVLIPAPAQGALALECRTADREIVDILRKIDHPAYSTVSDSGELTLQAGVFALDGSRQLLETATANVDKADELGRKVAAALLERGAHEVMGDTLRESQK